MKNKAMILLSVIVLLGLVFFLLNGHQTDNDFNTSQPQFLAKGTIPAEAKIYPIVNEDLPMTVDDETQILSDEDIYILTHYVDLWASANDTRGKGWQKEEVAKFISQSRLEQVEKSITSDGYSYSVDGVQILTIALENPNQVQVIYIVKLTGETTELAEGTYESVDALRFKKVNGKWYENGVSFIVLAPSGTLEYELDPNTGEYSIIDKR